MQLTATSKAQFFIQNEYHHVEIKENSVLLSSIGSEEHIPFTIWNGKVSVKRGLLWSSLQFFAHEHEGKQQSWLVQGLPWPQCRKFALEAVRQYQEWHNTQCRKLAEYLPKWEEELYKLKHLPAYLSHSQVVSWVESLNQELSEMKTTLEEAKMRMPNRMSQIEPWLIDTSEALGERNRDWLEAERPNWEVLFNQIESSPLNLSQQYAVLLNDDHNLVLAGAGSGKTSVLTARVAYLLQSHQAQAEELLMLAFGRDAATEMKERLVDKVGMAADGVRVNTFHQLGLYILKQVEQQPVEISPLALDENQRTAWCVDWLKKTLDDTHQL